MTDKQKQWIAWAIVAVAVVVAGFLGVTYPVPAPPQAAQPQVQATAIYPPGAIYFESGGKSQVFQSGASGTYLSGSKLDTRNGANVLLHTATITNVNATTITATNIISQAVGFDTTGDGTAAAPAYTFLSDPNTGLYSVAANDIGLSTNGVLRFDVSTTAATSALPVAVPAGTAAAPNLYVTGDTNTGLYQVAADDVGISAGGTLRLDVSATAVTAAVPVVIPAGSVSAPGLALAGDSNTGLYTIGANNIGVTTNGVIAMDASATAITFGLPVHGPAEGAVVYSAQHDVTAAEINAGHTIITVPAARTFRLVDAKATAYGATCTTSTSVLLKGGANTLATYTVANLVRSTLLELTTTGVTLAADGASFAVQTAGDDVTVISNSADTAGCTGVRFEISYVLE